MPARSKWVLCKCSSCPHEGKFFQTDEIAGHRASVAAIQRRRESSTHSSKRQNSESVPNSLIIESVERLMNTGGLDSSLGMATCLPDSVGRADEALHAFGYDPSQNQSLDAVELLERIKASLERESCRLRALERSISSWSPTNSQALLSVEREVTNLRLKSSISARSMETASKARGEIRLLCDSIEARVLEVKTLVGLTGTGLRNVDCGEYSVRSQERGDADLISIVLSESYFASPIDGSDGLVQSVIFIGLVCNVILLLSRRATSLIIGLVRVVVRTALAIRASPHDAVSAVTMDRIPVDPRTILSKCNLTGRTTTYAACPKCHFTYKPSYVHGSVLPTYPITCANKRHPDSPICAAQLVRQRVIEGITVQSPIRPFVYHSVLDFVGALFSRRDLEEQIDRACDDALRSGSPQEMRAIDDVFQGEFLRTFQGPRSRRLFIDRRGEGRLAFSLNVDFFNVNGNRAGGAVTSCGIIAMACLNLSPRVRYKFENLHIVGIIPGPREPDLEAINGFLKPLMDDMVELWDPGVQLSRTALCEHGRVVRGALACVVCDLPAARKVAALANHRSGNFLCSLCRKTRANIDNMRDSPSRRSSLEMRSNAHAWATASTNAQQEAIFQSAGVRFSELWRLCYWDPTRQLVIDPMHNLLLGVAQDHFRNVLSCTSTGASAVSTAQPAFSYAFEPVPAKEANSGHPIHTPGGKDYMDDKAIEDVSKIHKRLVLPLATTERTGSASLEAFSEHLSKKHKYKALEFVCKSLDISPEWPSNTEGNSRLRKIHWAKALASWVSPMIDWRAAQ